MVARRSGSSFALVATLVGGAGLLAPGAAHAVNAFHWQSVLDQMATAQARASYLNMPLSSVRQDVNSANSMARIRSSSSLATALSNARFARTVRPVRTPLKFKPTTARVGGLARVLPDNVRPFSFGRVFSGADDAGAIAGPSFGGLREGGGTFSFGLKK